MAAKHSFGNTISNRIHLSDLMQINEFTPSLATADSPAPMKSRRQGRLPIPPETSRRVGRPRRAPAASAGLEKLTPREYEVLVHLSKGLRYKEITDRLGISQGTLHFFIRNLYAKLRVHSRTEAVMKLVKR